MVVDVVSARGTKKSAETSIYDYQSHIDRGSSFIASAHEGAVLSAAGRGTATVEEEASSASKDRADNDDDEG